MEKQQKTTPTTDANSDPPAKLKPRKRYKANVRVIKKGKYRPKVYFD